MIGAKDMLQAIAFQQDRQPRAWLRHFLLKNQETGEPRGIFTRVIFKKNGCVRAVFSDWYERYLQNSSSAQFAPYLSFIRGQIVSGRLARATTLHIVTTPHTAVLGEVLSDSLEGTRLIVSRSLEMPQEFDHDLYLVVAPQMFSQMPPAAKTIMMQVEQVRASSWVTPSYLEKLNNSLGILDYSQDNIDALVKRGLPSKQLFYVPLIPYVDSTTTVEDRDIDVLFYGALSSTRREKYIKALSQRFKIRVESNLFGEDLRNVLKRTKVVVNIHFYENALLESTRLMEAVKCGAKVLSETAQDQDSYEGLLRNVTFVDSGNISAFCAALEDMLKPNGASSPDVHVNEFSETKYHVLRAFNALGIFDYDELFAKVKDYSLPSDRLVLSLPEQSERYEFARKNLLPRTAMFHGLRNIDGWKGCASSYKLISSIAIREDRQSLLIYEDDADIPSDAVQRLEVVEDFLSQLAEEWDVFSGLITDIDKDVEIFDVNMLRDEVFVHTSAFVGLVFCLYSSRMLKQIAEFEFVGNDILKHTIDRQLEAQHPRCVTTMKPLVGHAEEFSSSIWNNKNSHSSSMIAASATHLEAAVKRYSQAHDITIS